MEENGIEILFWGTYRPHLTIKYFDIGRIIAIKYIYNIINKYKNLLLIYFLYLWYLIWVNISLHYVLEGMNPTIICNSNSIPITTISSAITKKYNRNLKGFAYLASEENVG